MIGTWQRGCRPAALLSLALCVVLASALSIPVQAVELDPADRAYLDSLGSVTMVVDPDWEPYERIHADGTFSGIAADLIALVSERLQIPFVVVPTKDWVETLERSRAGGAHIIPFLNQTAAREEWLIFSDPIFADPNVFITRQEHPYITDLAAFDTARMVLPHGTSIEHFLRRDYPQLTILTTTSELEALRMVSRGEADMTLRSLMVAAYTIRKEGLFNLKISGEQAAYANHLRIGVQRDMPQLRDILNQAIATITPREREAIINRHVYISIEQPANLRLLLGIMAFMLLMLGLLGYRNARIRTHLRERQRMAAQLQQVIDLVPSYIFARDMDGTFLMANQATADVMGIAASDIVGKNLCDFGASAEERELYLTTDREAVAGGTAINIAAEPIRRADGSVGWFQVVKVPYHHPGFDGPAILGVATDITARKEAEEALRASNEELAAASAHSHQLAQANAEFLATMSHEIRTPLNGIIGMVELLLATTLNDAQRHQAEVVRASGQHLLRLINEILDISRMEAGGLQLEVADHDLRMVVHDALALVTQRAQAKDLPVLVEWSPQVPEVVRVDGGRLQQILINLLGNAIKFTERGQITLQVDLAPTATAGEQNCVIFSICDSGIGIPAEQLDQLFQKFRQADASTARLYGGSGLGLSICKQLVTLMGGDIEVSSSVGVGSVFTVRLPLDRGSASALARERVEPVIPAGLHGLRALVVDDSPINVEVAIGMLRSLGLEAHGVAAAEVALQRLRDEDFDLVFMDVQMPGMDGLEATRRLRAADSGVRNPQIRVIAMTARAFASDRDACISAGMDAHCPKPMDRRQVLAVLGQWCTTPSSDQDANDQAVAAAANQIPAIWDDGDLRERLQGDLDMLRDVIADYLREVSIHGQELRAALSSGDMDTAQSLAHRMRGTAASVAANAIAAVTASIEDALRGQDLATARQQLSNLDTGIADFRAAVRRQL